MMECRQSQKNLTALHIDDQTLWKGVQRKGADVSNSGNE